MKSPFTSSSAFAACCGLLVIALSAPAASAQFSFHAEGCGTVVADPICTIVWHRDDDVYFLFPGVQDFHFGDRVYVSGDVCVGCLQIPCAVQEGVYLTADLSPCTTGDVSFDGVVNSIDLGIMLTNWSIPGTAPGCGGAKGTCYSDINGDGFVNSIDLALLLIHWTF